MPHDDFAHLRKASSALPLKVTQSVSMRRGILRWISDKEILVQTKVKDHTGREGNGDFTVTDQTNPTPRCFESGSLVTSSGIGTRKAVLYTVDDITPQFCRIWWTYSTDRGVETRVWTYNGTMGPSRLLENALDYGNSHRLVVYVPNLEFEDEQAIWGDGILVRFATSIGGIQVKPRATATPNGDEHLLVFHYRNSATWTGRFVEIIATDQRASSSSRSLSAPISARDRAHGVWATIVNILGENAVGEEIVFDLPIEHPEGDESASVFSLYVSVPTPISNDDMDSIANSLVWTGRPASETNSLALALMWQLQSLRSSDSRDQFLSAFSGLEVILREHSKKVGLSSRASQLYASPHLHNQFDQLMSSLRSEDAAIIEARLRDPNPSLGECFDRFLRDYDWPKERIAVFRRLRRLRNPVAHGSRLAVSSNEVKDVRLMLAAAITDVSTSLES